MFKWLGQQVHVVFARHSNWLVKVDNAFTVAFGGIIGFNWGVTRLYLWLCGSLRPSTQVRLHIFDKILEFNKTLLAEKEQAFFTRINRIGLSGNCIPKNGPKNAELRAFLDETINTHKSVIQSKEIRRLYFKISLLESAKVKLQEKIKPDLIHERKS